MMDAFTLESRGKQMACLLSYRDESAKGKKVILYKHGFMGNKISPHRMVVNLGFGLAEKGYTLMRFDSVGAGDSEGDCHYTTIGGEIQDTRVVLRYIRDTLKAEKLIMLGYSMGGCVGPLACEEVVPNGMILWSPVADLMGSFEQHMGKERFALGRSGQDVDFNGDRVGKEFFVQLDSGELDLLPAMRAYKGPVRIIHGDGDTDIPVYNSHMVEQAAPDATLHIISGANHGYDAIPWQEELFQVTAAYVDEICSH